MSWHRRFAIAALSAAAVFVSTGAALTRPLLAAGGGAFWSACVEDESWSFSAPLTLAFLSSASVTQSYTSSCEFGYAYADTSTVWPLPVSEGASAGLPSSYAVAEPVSGSCVLATVGTPSGQGLLLGGVVLVGAGSAGGAASAWGDVAVLATADPCVEWTALGAGTEPFAGVSTF